MAISEGSWDGSASRFTDAQYERSCVLDRKKCGGDAAKDPPKTRCALPIRDPDGTLNRSAVHAAASRIGQVKGACPAAISAAKSALRAAYKTLGEDPPDSLSRAKGHTDDPGVCRDRALATDDHEWEFSRSADGDGEYLGTLAGHFAVFNKWAEINSPLEGHFMERVVPGAFSKTFAENQRNIRVLFQHGKDPSVGMRVLGPIKRLEEDERGAYYEVGLHDTSFNRDLIPGLRDGQYGASFRFAVVREQLKQFPERSADNPQGLPESSIAEAKVREFGPVTFGAYEGATSGLRSLNDELNGIDLRMLATSEPKTLASFARTLSEATEESSEPPEAEVGPQEPEAGANDGTSPAEYFRDQIREALEQTQRAKPTSTDWSQGYALKSLKQGLAGIKADQLTDPDNDTDPDDADVSDALDGVDGAIDTAIKAQAKDGSYDDTEDSDESDSAIMPRTEQTSPKETTRAPAEGVPDRPAMLDHSRKPFGSTLKKRAAPLKVKQAEEEPLWLLPSKPSRV